MTGFWIAVVCVALCVAAIVWSRIVNHTERPGELAPALVLDPEPDPFDLENYIMSLSARAQAIADELGGLPALMNARVAADVASAEAASAAASAAVQAQADEDLTGVQAAADAAVAAVSPAPVVVAADVPVA